MTKDKKGKRKRDNEEGFPLELLEAAKNGGGAERKALLDSMVEDYYNLDYEDKVRQERSFFFARATDPVHPYSQIGDLPTRFRYAKVAPSSYSLTPSEILLATDMELNSYVSLRKMAPYRHDDEATKSKSKKRLKEFRDSQKHREWGVELDENEEAAGTSKKRKWSEENGRTKKVVVGGEGEEKKEGGTAVKRIGKKQRDRARAKALLEGGGEDA